MNMNGTYCSAPVVERVKCNERNYTNFKLAEYAVKNYSWFFIDDKYETRRFNDSFNSIIYSNGILRLWTNICTYCQKLFTIY